jgi:hypothetical protein|tara:strand:- start:485 stop:811 length:327 start_codon:yes stop_codon:yes gene_type:complete
MTKAKLPDTIKVGYQIYDVKVERFTDGHPSRGSHNYFRSEILVDADQSAQLMANTMCHEILHAAYSQWEMGAGELDEERIVATLANGLCTIFRDNPDLGKWLLERLAK